MRYSVTKALLILITFLLLVVVSTFLWTQLPDAEPARLRQECKGNLQQIYLSLIKIGQTNDIASKASIESRLSEHLLSQQKGNLLRCPGADDQERKRIVTDYHINPNVDLKKLSANDCEKSLIVACDKLGNHKDCDGELINFLLADGSVVFNNIDAEVYEAWISSFCKGVPEAMHFPIAELNREVPTTNEPVRSKNSTEPKAR